MKQRINIWICVCTIALMSASASVFAILPYGSGRLPIMQDTNKRYLTIHLRGVFDTKVSVQPINGIKTIKTPVVEIPSIKNGETATLEVPSQYIPCEFVLKFEYRTKESDNPRPSKKNIFINKQNIELFVNPQYIEDSDSAYFAPGEMENTVYGDFIVENSKKRMQADMLKQVLFNYDRPKSKFYAQGIKEYEQRRLEYNQWLNDKTKTYSYLFVSRLFRFQYMPAITWLGNENKRLNGLLKNYFEGIDFNDTLIVRSSVLNEFMDDYMGLYGMQATSKELQDSFFTEAGSNACEKASKGHPVMYGWMVDYFYVGYEAYHIYKGMAMLQKHINSPNCLTSKKKQIIKRLEGMTKLVSGALSPDFILTDNDSNKFDFHAYKTLKEYKLLLFWSASCEHCQQLVKELTQWYNVPENNKKLDIIAVSLDETEIEVQQWKNAIVSLPGWKHLFANKGINSVVANDYAILSTPVMFLVESKSNIIKDIPDNLDKLIEDLGNK